MATARNDHALEAFPVGDFAMRNFKTDRERVANDLAERLFFELEKQGNRYSLCR